MHLNPRPTLFVLSLGLMGVLLSGCERKETILDIRTPDGQIEVERSLDTGAVDVEVTED